MQEYKQVERDHYDSKATDLEASELSADGSLAIAAELRAPYVAFERAIREHAHTGARVVDLGAGTGIHSLAAREADLRIALDISFPALLLAAKRGARGDTAVTPVVCDAEQTPFREQSIDLVTSAGALYCFDFDRICREVRRILRPDGVWVIVDSFDHNPVYRLNRRIGFLRGRRTRRAVTNIPSQRWIERLEQQFERVKVAYFGSASFLGPVLKRLVGAERTGRIIDAIDRSLPGLRRFAFKIVVTAAGPKNAGR